MPEANPDKAEKRGWAKRINVVVQRLYQPLTPDEFMRIWEDEANKLWDEFEETFSGHTLFDLPAARPLWDAYVVGQFALLAGADEVRLEASQWPDGVVRFGDTHINVEATEALEPYRRRGGEYKSEEATITYDPVENWRQRLSHIPAVLADVIEKKHRKHYGLSSVLVVYLNIGTYGLGRIETEAIIKDYQKRLRGRFDAIHVLWDGVLYRGDTMDLKSH